MPCSHTNDGASAHLLPPWSCWRLCSSSICLHAPPLLQAPAHAPALALQLLLLCRGGGQQRVPGCAVPLDEIFEGMVGPQVARVAGLAALRAARAALPLLELDAAADAGGADCAAAGCALSSNNT
jgi:hypothetical protein